MDAWLFHLRARSPFHFGTRGVGIEESGEYAPSDTLFSALCSVFRLLEGVEPLEALLAQFKAKQPPFLCSSAFPYAVIGNDVVRFYPAPLTLRHQAEKDIRKTRWISESLFERFIQNTPIDSFEALRDGVRVTTQEKQALGGNGVWGVGEVPRVAVDRLSNASAVYQAGRLNLTPGGGLWCAFTINDARSWPVERLADLLSHLGEQGLGGERSAGHGQFEVASYIKKTYPDVAGRAVTLSHFRPEADELPTLDGAAAYELVARRGWMSSPDGSNYRHRSVRMVSSGSVLQLSQASQRVYGGLVDVTPEVFKLHKVWRYGFAFPVGMKGA